MSIQHVILAILESEPRSVPEIQARVANLLGDFRPVNRGQVYAVLKRLTEKGQVRRQAEPSRSSIAHIHLGVTGRRALERWLGRIERQVVGPPETLARIAHLLEVAHSPDSARQLLRTTQASLDRAKETVLRSSSTDKSRKQAGSLLQLVSLAASQASVFHLEAELESLRCIDQQLPELARALGTSLPLSSSESRAADTPSLESTEASIKPL